MNESFNSVAYPKTGFLLGRFQPFHSGHLDMLRQAGFTCERVVILVGSSQESRTQKNPFSFEERVRLMREAIDTYRELHGEDSLPKDILMIPIADQNIGNNISWGRYVIDYLTDILGYTPNIAFSGMEDRRQSWYAELSENVWDVQLKKFGDYHATDIRKAIMDTRSDNEDVQNQAYDYLADALPAGLNSVAKIKYLAAVIAESTDPKTASV